VVLKRQKGTIEIFLPMVPRKVSRHGFDVALVYVQRDSLRRNRCSFLIKFSRRIPAEVLV
jgi:predicted GNAT family acetyltransferase